MTIEELVETVTSKANELGMKLSKEDWREACEELADGFNMSAEAVREELEDEVEP